MQPAEMVDGFGVDPKRGAWCPRRLESGSTRDMPDTWDTDRGHRSCSYCGSAHPDEVMAAIRAGAVELGPTDKNYKLYLEQPAGAEPRLGIKFYLQHLSADQRREFVDLYNEREVRDYTQAVDHRQADDEIKAAIVAAGQPLFADFTVVRPGVMKFGFPGYLYAGAFFMTNA